MSVVIAIDAGTTGVRSLAVRDDGSVAGYAYREFPQHFPAPGLVEHDADDIWAATETTLGELVAGLDDPAVAAIGITNQRETTVVWDRRSGRPLHRALVWQDRRTAARCDELREQGREPLFRERTGLVLDPYFSGTKIEWLIRQGGVDPGRRAESAEHTVAVGFDGYAVGGLSGGEDRSAMMPALEVALAGLPTDRPRYHMGVGDPSGIVEAVAQEVPLRHGLDLPPLESGARLFRGAVTVPAPRLHLHEGQRARARGHQVELDAAGPHVARQDPPAAPGQVARGALLALGAEGALRVALRHGNPPGTGALVR